MSDTFWKAIERRILREWFGLTRIGGTGRKNPDARGEGIAIEIFTGKPTKKMLEELKQAEDDLENSPASTGFIPWAIMKEKHKRDEDSIIYTKLKYFPKAKEDL